MCQKNNSNTVILLAVIFMIIIGIFCSWAGYQAGYVNGQIDYQDGKIRWKKVVTTQPAIIEVKE